MFLFFHEATLGERTRCVGDKLVVGVFAGVVNAPKHGVNHSARHESGEYLQRKFDFVRVFVFGELILYRVRDGVLYRADDLAVAVAANYVCDMIVFVKEEINAHNYHRIESFGRGGEFRVLGEFLIEVVFEFLKRKGQKVVFVFEVRVECGAVDHRSVAKVDNADFLDRFFFHHIEQGIA